MSRELRPPLEPMEARTVRALPAGDGWLFEPKWDGFRALCFRSGDDVDIQSKSGQPLARYFPEVVAALRNVREERFVLDGELLVTVDDALDFDQLLQRIHPAESRVRELARRFPATYLAFDALAVGGDALADLPLRERRERLESFAASAFAPGALLKLSPATRDRAVVERWYASVGGALDGVVAKRIESPYGFGSRDDMQKLKRLRTADCVVGGFRTTGEVLGSLLLGLYDDDGDLDYVGFTSGFGAAEKASLLPRLRAIAAEASFAKRVPGGPSRWNRGKDTSWTPVRPELVLEVEFDHVTNGRFRHGTRPLRFRPDKAPRACTFEQMAQPKGTSPFTLAAAGSG